VSSAFLSFLHFHWKADKKTYGGMAERLMKGRPKDMLSYEGRHENISQAIIYY
jgi:hypothetical protein